MATKLKPGTSNAVNRSALIDDCEVYQALSSISPRWKMQVLHHIITGSRQFGQLKAAFPSLSDQILSKRLSELVQEKIIDRSVVEGTAPRQIIYQPTAKGLELIDIIYELRKWALKW